MGSGDKRHPHEAEWLRFMAGQRSDYVRQSAAWLRTEYPGSVAKCVPILKGYYNDALAREDAANRRAWRSG